MYYVCLCVHLFKDLFANHVLARIIYLCSNLARIVTTETVTTETVTTETATTKTYVKVSVVT